MSVFRRQFGIRGCVIALLFFLASASLTLQPIGAAPSPRTAQDPPPPPSQQRQQPPGQQGQQGQQPQEGQQGLIKVDTSLVNVPVIVTDRAGQFITGLGRPSFRIFEDGVLQEISSFSSTEAPFNVALLIDTSHSTQRKLGAIRKAALTFVKQLQPRDRVAIVTFDDQVTFLGDFTSDRKSLESSIASVKSNYRTSLYDAIARTVNEKLSNIPGRKAIVVLSDGVDTASKLASFDEALELVATAGVIAYSIQYETRNDGGPIMKPMQLPGIKFVPSSFVAPQTPRSGSGQTAPRDKYLVAADFLKFLAMGSGGRYLRAESIESTSYAFALIAEELRNQYTLAYYSTNEKRDGRFRAINVRLDSANLYVRARSGYRAPLNQDTDSEKKTSGRP